MSDTEVGIEDVPVPFGGTRDEQLSKSDCIVVRYPPTTPFDELRTFYDVEMPIGKPWRGLLWNGAGEQTEQIPIHRREWRRGRTDDFLGVDVVYDDAAGPVIMIYDARDDPDPLELQIRMTPGDG